MGEWTFNLVEDRQMFEVVLALASMAPELVIDTETTDEYKGAKTRASLCWDGRVYCTGIGIGFEANGIDQYYYLPWRHELGNLPGEWLPEFKDLILCGKPLIFHNFLFDHASLATLGILVPEELMIWDSMVMAHFINEEFPSKQLDWLAKFVLKDEGKDDGHLKLLLKGLRWGQIPPAIMCPYCCKDCRITHLLKRVFYNDLI